MKLIGRRSVASALRWVLGFVNIFVTVGVIATGLLLLTTLIVPDFAVGFMNGLAESDSGLRPLLLNERASFLAAFIASLSTWWILNRLRRMCIRWRRRDKRKSKAPWAAALGYEVNEFAVRAKSRRDS